MASSSTTTGSSPSHSSFLRAEASHLGTSVQPDCNPPGRPGTQRRRLRHRLGRRRPLTISPARTWPMAVRATLMGVRGRKRAARSVRTLSLGVKPIGDRRSGRHVRIARRARKDCNPVAARIAGHGDHSSSSCSLSVTVRRRRRRALLIERFEPTVGCSGLSTIACWSEDAGRHAPKR